MRPRFFSFKVNSTLVEGLDLTTLKLGPEPKSKVRCLTDQANQIPPGAVLLNAGNWGGLPEKEFLSREI